MSHEELDRFEHMMKSMIEQNEATIKAVVASNDASNQIVLYKLDQMELNQNSMLTAVNKTNGSVAAIQKEQYLILQEQELIKKEHENSLNQHIMGCPNIKRINTLENDNITKATMRKMMFQGVGLVSTIIGAVYIFIKLILGI